MKMLIFLKTRLFVLVAAGVIVVGGATVVLAATPAGQQVFQASSHAAQVTKTPEADSRGQQGQANTCPGLADAQNLATKYTLSSNSQGSAVQSFCALHTGAFTGTAPDGSAVSSNRAFGYGEIDQLLTYASYLAAQDQANGAGKLTDGNVQSYLAEALNSCGTSPLEQCLKTNIPNYQPGNSGNGNGKGNGKGKPEGTPTPHH